MDADRAQPSGPAQPARPSEHTSSGQPIGSPGTSPRPNASPPARFPAGVRPASTEGRPDPGTLVYVDPGSVAPAPGEWVVFADEHGERVGQVVIAPEQVVESAIVGPLPPVLRHARPDEHPATRAATAGSRLLESLDLPAWAVESGGSPERSGEAAETAGS